MVPVFRLIILELKNQNHFFGLQVISWFISFFLFDFLFCFGVRAKIRRQ